jgi:hypothetical protein
VVFCLMLDIGVGTWKGDDRNILWTIDSSLFNQSYRLICY